MKNVQNDNFACELCLFRYGTLGWYPNFFHFMWNCWNFQEKVTYASSFCSSILSLWFSFKGYQEENQKKGKAQTKSKNSGKLKQIFEIFLYGWPPRLKYFMVWSLLVVLFGNYFAYRIWRVQNMNIYVLPYASEFDPEINSQLKGVHEEKRQIL